MAKRENWSDEENSVLVQAYLGMLRQELLGEPFVKADVRRRLQMRIDRSDPSIEYKFRNVSAVLRDDLRFLFINGYKPAPNIQGSLRGAVRTAMEGAPDLTEIARQAVMRDFEGAALPVKWSQGTVPDAELLAPPAGQHVGKWDFIKLEAMNRTLGDAGERAVVARERSLLEDAGEFRLAARVEHVSQTLGDGLGFDVRSFTSSGEEKLIEVKTTQRGALWPMLISRNEVDVSADLGDRYHLYRLHDFKAGSVHYYSLRGDMREACQLEAETYRALPARLSA